MHNIMKHTLLKLFRLVSNILYTKTGTSSMLNSDCYSRDWNYTSFSLYWFKSVLTIQ